MFLSNFFRINKILFIFVKNYLNPKLNKGQKIAQSLEELGPFFIKLGQTLATRPDLISFEIANELAYLHDNLPSFSYIEAKKIFEDSVGEKIENLFKDFSIDPVQAASIAQVHKAITLDGDEVAVKILRPNIKQIFARDIKLLRFLAKYFDYIFKNYRRLKLTKIIDLLENTIKTEINLSMEAAACAELAEKNQLPDIHIPKIYWALTSLQVLTTEWINGISIYKIEELKKNGFDMQKLAKSISSMFFNQAYVIGFFHADLHPGNILITKDAKIALIDFGIMGRLDYVTRIHVAEILYGFITRNYDLVAKIHFDAGYVPSDKSLELFSQSLRSIGEPIVGIAAKDISIAKLLAKLFQVTEEFSMETQPQLLLLQRTMVVIEGLCIKLDPEINMWQAIEPQIKEWALENIEIEARIKRKAKDFFTFLIDDLPNYIKKNLQ